MADNIQLNPAVGGGDTARAEDVGGGIKIPASKLYTGPAGVDGGPVTMTNPLPVVIADGDNDGRAIDVEHINGRNALAVNIVDPSLREAWELTRIAVESLVDQGNAQACPDTVARAASANATGIVVRPAGANTLPTWTAVRITDADGAFAMPTMDAAARRGFVTVTDGTNAMPTGDAAARGIYHRITDGTNAAAVKAASVAAAAADPALVVSLSPNSGVVGREASGAEQKAAPVAVAGVDERGLVRPVGVQLRNGATSVRTYDEDARKLLEEVVVLLSYISATLAHMLPAGAARAVTTTTVNT